MDDRRVGSAGKSRYFNKRLAFLFRFGFRCVCHESILLFDLSAALHIFWKHHNRIKRGRANVLPSSTAFSASNCVQSSRYVVSANLSRGPVRLGTTFPSIPRRAESSSPVQAPFARNGSQSERRRAGHDTAILFFLHGSDNQLEAPDHSVFQSF